MASRPRPEVSAEPDGPLPPLDSGLDAGAAQAEVNSLWESSCIPALCGELFG